MTIQLAAPFLFNEGAIDLPDGWEDRSAADDESLASYVDRQLVDMAKSCPRFELARRERTMLDGDQAESMEFSWRSPDGNFVRQKQTIVRLKSGTALALTGTAPAKRFSDYADVFHNLVRTFRRRKGE
jgi:hypothetical protein